MIELITHHETLHQVKVPLPFPLRWVNSYMIRGSNGYTVIDPGLRTVQAESLWEQVMKQLKIGFTDIEQIVLTHYHPDHYGLAGWMQERSQAPVWLSRTRFRQATRLWGEDQSLSEDIIQLFSRHGMSESILVPLREHLDGFVSHVSPQPQPSFIEAGGSLRMGDDYYDTIDAPGHADGHLCFYDKRSKVIFCGDQVLPQISPNVSLIPSSDENPLRSFLNSLADLSELEVEYSYPGHREPFDEFSSRALELIRHHEQRLEHMLQHLDEPMTAYDLCVKIFGERLSIHQLRFAMAETLAHVVYLRQQGSVMEVETGKVAAFVRVDAI